MIKNKEDLKKYLEDNNITQSDFARKIDKDISLITRWLNGERNIPNNINVLLGLEKGLIEQNFIKNVCKNLNLTYSQLADEIGYEEQSVSHAGRRKVSKPMQKSIELYLKTIKREDLLIRSNEVVQTEENLIKKACEEFQVTQKELAEIMKINDVTVRNWSSVD
ncbi:helix-turn-helix domain-containing protein [Aliarcobacter butzleri]